MNLKKTLIFFYIWVLLEGILRKWVVPGLSNALFLGKLVFSIYFAFVLIKTNRKKILQDKNIIIALTIYMLFLCFSFCLGALNFGPIVPILGLSVHVAYFPLFFMIPLALKTKQGLFKFLNFLNFIILLVFILGIYQYTLPPDHFLNKYVAETEYISQVGNAVRITTIFPYITLSQYYIVFTALLSFAQFVLNSGNKLIVSINVILGVACVFMTGSRYSLGFYIFTSVLFLMLAKPFKVISFKQFARIFIVLPVLVLIGLQTSFFQNSLENFQSRINNSDSSEGRLLEIFTPFKFSETAGFFGHGLGVTASPAQSFIYDRSSLPSYWEEESERIAIEQGMLGFIILVIFRFTVLLFLFKVMNREKDKKLRGLLLFFFIYQIPAVLVMSQTNYAYIENIIYCSQIGVLLFIAARQKQRYIDESYSI
ncbi:hypothetical protein [Algibacter lectus]|uniref:hypothetical protein n=1 Tax=Algibacter lectus TaxID=221126 RepID=UPI0011137E02|nr:hypothetical protein [Algibacter lectus]